MKHCTNCGVVVVITALFCYKCSKQVLPAPDLNPLAELDNGDDDDDDDDDVLFLADFPKKSSSQSVSNHRATSNTNPPTRSVSSSSLTYRSSVS